MVARLYAASLDAAEDRMAGRSDRWLEAEVEKVASGLLAGFDGEGDRRLGGGCLRHLRQAPASPHGSEPSPRGAEGAMSEQERLEEMLEVLRFLWPKGYGGFPFKIGEAPSRS